MELISALVLSALGFQSTPPKKAVPRRPAGWVVETSTSAMDDSETVTLTLRARNAITAWPRSTVTPNLILRCKEGSVDAFIHFGARAAVERGGTTTLWVRFDTAPAISMVTSGFTNGLAYFVSDAKSFIEDLLRTEKLLVRFTPFNSSPQDTLFMLVGVKESIVQLRRACRWDPEAEAAAAKKAEEEGRSGHLRALLDQAEPAGRRQEAARSLASGFEAHPDAIVALTKALLTDPSPDVRMTCATRLGDVGRGNVEVASALREAVARETNPLVANAMNRALGLLEPAGAQ